MENEDKKFINLKKWEGTLACCIRCGYCYEHCPMFKYTGWESDAPRAKIITAFGLLNGNLKPTKESSDKLFNCFYCRRCEAACSSGVKLTDIFVDAKKDLLSMGFQGPGTTAVTDMNCARCLVCIDACPHDARFYNEDKGIITDPVKCQSCGTCVEVCPAGAIHIENHFGTSTKSLTERTVNFLNSQVRAKAIIFACNWSYYPELMASKLPESELHDKDYEILVNMCGGRLETQLLMTPFLNGAWGVLVACCPDGECQHDGNKKAFQLIQNIKSNFEVLNIDTERIQLVQIPAGDKSLFQAEIDTFIDKLEQMGPIH